MRKPGHSNDAKLGEFITASSVRLPALVVHEQELEHNIRTLATYIGRDSTVAIAPHGKTTLCPAIFAKQLKAGAWGITVASVAQAEIACTSGTPRILIANEIVDSNELAHIIRLEHRFGCEIFLLVDSDEGAQLLEAAAEERNRVAATGPPKRVKVLLELGVKGGRTGVRSTSAALRLAEKIRSCAHLALHGVEGYEGVIGNDRSSDTLAHVRAYLEELGGLATTLARSELLEPWDGHYLISAGGSRYFDLVTEILPRSVASVASTPFTVILRSGCYVAHDNGIYEATSPLGDRSAAPDEPLRLRPAGEVWCEIVSVPEPGLAILNAGRRDISFDAGMPVPLHYAPPGGTVSTAPREWAIEKLDDQHGYLRATGCTIGTRVGLGFSHPCTTFDKWSTILFVNANYEITGEAQTGFGGDLESSS